MVKYVLVDTLNDQAWGPFGTDYEAAQGAIDIWQHFGETDRQRAMKLRAKLITGGVDSLTPLINDNGMKLVTLQRPIDWTNLR